MNNLPEKIDQPSIDAVTIKDIPVFPDYKVDSTGLVYSRRRERAKGGKLKQHTGNHGYKTVALFKNKKQYTQLVHRLVLETFVGPCPDGMEACHNNGIRTDNRVTNLRWDTRSNNHKDKVVHGTSHRGESNPASKYTKELVEEICGLYDSGHSTINELTTEYNIPYGTVYYLVKRLRWSHLWER